MAGRPIILITACLLAAGCGSSSPKSTASASSFGAQALAFSKCMRAHGVPSFPDPGAPAGPGESSFLGIAIPSTIDMQSPAVESAFSGCRHVITSILSPQGKAPITAALKESLIAHAQCMRTHGVPAFQDPVFPPGGGIETFEGPGVNPQSPAYQHAEAACPGR
ncbi:MAG TPA: hypothetical protein VMA77_30960 [Solirubrobacteraceae bacterium]|nr:hypothetical protein [Solirubrobacteraceae bacterium]